MAGGVGLGAVPIAAAWWHWWSTRRTASRSSALGHTPPQPGSLKKEIQIQLQTNSDSDFTGWSFVKKKIIALRVLYCKIFDKGNSR